MSMTQQEIEALMNGEPEVEPDFGSDEFEKLIKEAYKSTTYNNFHAHSVQGKEPEEMFNNFENLFKEDLIDLRKRKDKVIKMKESLDKLKKYMKDTPELFI